MGRSRRRRAGGKKKHRTAEELLAAAEKQVERCQASTALRLYQRAAELKPADASILDAIGELQMELGDPDAARRTFEKSIEMDSEAGSSKWFNLAQLVEGTAATECLEHGIAILTAQREKAEAEGDEVTFQRASAELAAAFCALTELYMSDLCFEEDAEARCESYMEQAMLYDPGLEVHQMMANLRLSQSRPDEAAECMATVLAGLKETADDDEAVATTYAFRIITVRLLIEVDMAVQATQLAEGLLAADDLNVEVWHLAGVAYYRSGKPHTALKYLSRAMEMLQANIAFSRSEDDGLLGLAEELEELLAEVGAAAEEAAAAGVASDDEMDEGEGEGEEEAGGAVVEHAEEGGGAEVVMMEGVDVDEL